MGIIIFNGICMAITVYVFCYEDVHDCIERYRMSKLSDDEKYALYQKYRKSYSGLNDDE